MTTQTMKKAAEVAPILLDADQLIRSLMVSESRYMMLESGRTGETELTSLWERQGRLEILGRDSTLFSQWLTARASTEEPRFSPVLSSQPSSASQCQPIRVLWCSVPITVLPLEQSKGRVHSYMKVCTASEADAFVALRAAECSPHLLLHQGPLLTGFWRLTPDQWIGAPVAADVWLQELSRKIPGSHVGSVRDLFALPSDAAVGAIVPRHSVTAQWNGAPDQLVSMGELKDWLWGDSAIPSPAPPPEESWRKRFTSPAFPKPY